MHNEQRAIDDNDDFSDARAICLSVVDRCGSETKQVVWNHMKFIDMLPHTNTHLWYARDSFWLSFLLLLYYFLVTYMRLAIIVVLHLDLRQSISNSTTCLSITIDSAIIIIIITTPKPANILWWCVLWKGRKPVASNIYSNALCIEKITF